MAGMRRALRKEISTCVLAGASALALGGQLKWARTLTVGALALRFWPAPKRSLNNAVVVITGGSRGLGLAMAEQFLREGAWVALLSRDRAELRRAQASLAEIVAGRTLILKCDVSEKDQLEAAIQKVAQVFGEIDVLVNNAGVMAVGPLETLNEADYDQVLKLSVHAVANATQSVRPIFQRQGQGHIVNICSIGGKIGVPHMASYSAGKFALAGLSAAMEAELRVDGIRVTTVFPGIMRVGSAIQANFKGSPEKEFAWFAMGTLLPGISISAEAAAERIVDAVRCGDSEVVFPASAQLAVLGQKVFPEISALIRQRIARAFPQGDFPANVSGEDSRGWLEERWWYRLFRGRARRLEERWNQV